MKITRQKDIDHSRGGTAPNIIQFEKNGITYPAYPSLSDIFSNDVYERVTVDVIDNHLTFREY